MITERPNFAKKLFLAFLLLVQANIINSALFAKSGRITELYSLKKNLNAKEDTKKQMIARKAQYIDQLTQFKDSKNAYNKEFIEQMTRQRLNYSKRNEIVIIVK